MLYLSNNCITKVKEIKYIENLPYLSELELCFNPVQSKKFYRLQILYILTLLRQLDGVLCCAEEFVKAENLYSKDTHGLTLILLRHERGGQEEDLP